MPTVKPNHAQATILLHLLTGDAYRIERGHWAVVGSGGTTLAATAVDEAVGNGWAQYGDRLPSMQRSLHLTDAGRSALTAITTEQ